MKLSSKAVLLMDEPSIKKKLSIDQRRRIFKELVVAQDEQLGVAESRRKVMTDHELSDEQLKEIENEGIDKEWPPLA